MPRFVAGSLSLAVPFSDANAQVPGSLTSDHITHQIADPDANNDQDGNLSFLSDSDRIILESAKDAGVNFSPGSKMCKSCKHIACVCPPKIEIEPEPEPDFEKDVHYEEAEGETQGENHSEDHGGFDQLVIAPGQTDFTERILNLIERDGNPDLAVDMIYQGLLGGKDNIADIATIAYASLTSKGFTNQASLLEADFGGFDVDITASVSEPSTDASTSFSFGLSGPAIASYAAAGPAPAPGGGFGGGGFGGGGASGGSGGGGGAAAGPA